MVQNLQRIGFQWPPWYFFFSPDQLRLQFIEAGASHDNSQDEAEDEEEDLVQAPPGLPGFRNERCCIPPGKKKTFAVENAKMCLITAICTNKMDEGVCFLIDG